MFEGANLDHTPLVGKSDGGVGGLSSHGFPWLIIASLPPIVRTATAMCNSGDPYGIWKLHVEDHKGEAMGETLAEWSALVGRPQLGVSLYPINGLSHH